MAEGIIRAGKIAPNMFIFLEERNTTGGKESRRNR